MLKFFYIFSLVYGMLSSGAYAFEYFGVTTHYGLPGKRGYQPDNFHENIGDFGFNSFRDDVSWFYYFPDESQDFGENLGALIGLVKNSGVKPVLVLTGGNPKVKNSNPPTTIEAIDSYAKYTGEVAFKLRRYNPIYELWNEWNMLARKNPAYTLDRYVLLAQKSYYEIKRNSPDSLVLVGSIGDDVNNLWLKALIESRVAHFSDGISVHLYNHCSKTSIGAEGLFKQLLSINEIVEPIGKKLYLTEFGWPNHIGKCAVDLRKVEENIIKFVALASTVKNVAGIWFYELKDSGEMPFDQENRFGLYGYSYEKKIPAKGIKEVAKIFSAYTASSVKFFDDGAYIKVLNNDTVKGYIYWGGDALRDIKRQGICSACIDRKVNLTNKKGVFRGGDVHFIPAGGNDE